jgi:hypothetical protein
MDYMKQDSLKLYQEYIDLRKDGIKTASYQKVKPFCRRVHPSMNIISAKFYKSCVHTCRRNGGNMDFIYQAIV